METSAVGFGPQRGLDVDWNCTGIDLMGWRQRLFGPSQKLLDAQAKDVEAALKVTQRAMNVSFDEYIKRKEAKLNSMFKAMEVQVEVFAKDCAQHKAEVRSQQDLAQALLDQLRSEISNLDAAQNSMAEQVGQAINESNESIEQQIREMQTQLNQLAAQQKVLFDELQQVVSRLGQLDSILPPLFARVSQLDQLPAAVEQAFSSISTGISKDILVLKKRLDESLVAQNQDPQGRDPQGRDPRGQDSFAQPQSPQKPSVPPGPTGPGPTGPGRLLDDSVIQQQLQMQMQLAAMLQNQLARADAQLAAAAAAADSSRVQRHLPVGAPVGTPGVPDPWAAPYGNTAPVEQVANPNTPDWRTPASQRAMLQAQANLQAGYPQGGQPYVGDPPRVEYPEPPAVDLEYVIVDPATEQITGYGPRV